MKVQQWHLFAFLADTQCADRVAPADALLTKVLTKDEIEGLKNGTRRLEDLPRKAGGN